MEVCKGNGPMRPAGGRSMHGVAKPQRCGALAVFDGYCPVHLKERGYSRCPTCSAWRQPPKTSGYPLTMAAPVCDVCSSMGGPTPHSPTCAREILRHADDSTAYLSEPCTCKTKGQDT